MSEAAPNDDGVVAWDFRIPLLTNRFMLWDFARVIVISLAVMWLSILVMSVAAGEDPLLMPAPFMLAMGGVLAALFLIACLLLGNRVGAWFGVGPAGVAWASGRRERAVNRGTAIVGLLAGSPGTAGAGLIATANESGAVEWRELRRAVYHPAQRVISVRNSWRTVVRLYCTPEGYDAVAAIVADGLARGAAERLASPSPKRSALAIAGWIAGPLLLAVLSLVWSFRPDETGLWVVLAAVFVVLAGQTAHIARRIFGAFAILPAAFAVLLTVSEALSTFDSLFGGVGRTWELDTPALVVSLAAQAVLGLLGLGLMVWPQRPAAAQGPDA